MKPFTNCDGCCDYCPVTTCKDRKTNTPIYTTTQIDITKEPIKEEIASKINQNNKNK